MAWAVRAMIGIAWVSTAPLSRLAACQPSITGKLISNRIRSGLSEWATSTPWAPSTARYTWNPLRSSRSESISRIISLSSTSKILAIGFLLYTLTRNLVFKALKRHLLARSHTPKAPKNQVSNKRDLGMNKLQYTISN